MIAVKPIKVLGTSEDSREAAAKEAIDRANASVEGISGIEIEDWTAEVEDGEITEYKAAIRIAFPVRDE